MEQDNKENPDTNVDQQTKQTSQQQVEKVEITEKEVEQIKDKQHDNEEVIATNQQTIVQNKEQSNQPSKQNAEKKQNQEANADRKQKQTKTLQKSSTPPQTKKQYIPPVSNPHLEVLVKHRRTQAETLRNLIKTMQQQLKGNQFHLHVLQKQKTELEDQVGGLDLRLKGILREKQVLFARLMTGQRQIERLQGM